MIGRRSPHTVLWRRVSHAKEDKDVDVQLLLFESFGGFGKAVREILWKAADVLQCAEQADAGPVPRRGGLDHQELAGAVEAAHLSRSSHGHRRADCE